MRLECLSDEVDPGADKRCVMQNRCRNGRDDVTTRQSWIL